jgi:hypothetical protein
MGCQENKTASESLGKTTPKGASETETTTVQKQPTGVIQQTSASSPKTGHGRIRLTNKNPKAANTDSTILH